MNVLIFGATGMVGLGVLRECLLADDVQRVQTVGRTPTGQQHPKLTELVHADLLRYEDIEPALTGFDACFFCLGVSSAGMSEAEYTRVSYDITLAAAQVLARLNPRMTFVYVSGAGTDSTEQGRSMWARVKGRTENALLKLPFKAAYMFRPGAIQPLHGIRSKTAAYRIPYLLLGPVLPLLRRLFPAHVTTTEQVGRAMLVVARRGFPRPLVEAREIAAMR
ncbi:MULTISPECIES: NAD(P)H-binding protein [Cupriavidus]